MDADLGLPWDGPNLAPSEQRLDTNTQWDLYAGVGYQFCDWCVGTLGYPQIVRHVCQGSAPTGVISYRSVSIGVHLRFDFLKS